MASLSRSDLQRKDGKNTQTCYKVLDSRDQCALVQLQPLTGVVQRCAATEEALQSGDSRGGGESLGGALLSTA